MIPKLPQSKRQKPKTHQSLHTHTKHWKSHTLENL
jgi:hypothetical protein